MLLEHELFIRDVEYGFHSPTLLFNSSPDAPLFITNRKNKLVNQFEINLSLIDLGFFGVILDSSDFFEGHAWF